MGSLFLKTRMHESHLRWHLKASCDEIFFFFSKEKACSSVSLSIGQKKKWVRVLFLKLANHSSIALIRLSVPTEKHDFPILGSSKEN